MDILITIIAVIVIFSVIVLVHEYGHFAAARRAGIKVLEFGIGFPPRIFKKKIGETVYSINAIPFGGFVRMYGEDSSDTRMLKDKRSFASKSAGARAHVVTAGVLMNLVLAVVLLTIGFSFGIEPLLVTEKDLLTHIEQGNVISSPGAFVSNVNDEAKKLGLEKGDKILAVDDKPVKDAIELAVFGKGKAVKDIDITVAQKSGGEVKRIHVPLVNKKNYFGIGLKPYTYFPRLTVLEVKKRSNSEKAGIRKGDVILKINNEEIYSPADMESILAESSAADFTVLRSQQILQIFVPMPDQRKVVIVEIEPDSAAQAAGFAPGDIITAVDGFVIAQVPKVPEILKQKPAGSERAFTIVRDGKAQLIKTKTGKNNMLGVTLSSISSFYNNEVSVYRDTILTSVIEIKKVRYGPWTAFKQAIYESARITKLTAAAFVKTFKTIFSRFAVPDEVGGPVQIAYYTHAFIQEGFFALLRFAALLSLSLAVLNILPLPALDGGRFLFIIIEVIIRRRVNARMEAIVHGLGFALLIGLIIFVTYSDIAKLL